MVRGCRVWGLGASQVATRPAFMHPSAGWVGGDINICMTFFFMTYQNSTAGGKLFPCESADWLIPHTIIPVCKLFGGSFQGFLKPPKKVAVVERQFRNKILFIWKKVQTTSTNKHNNHQLEFKCEEGGRCQCGGVGWRGWGGQTVTRFRWFGLEMKMSWTKWQKNPTKISKNLHFTFSWCLRMD